MTSPSNSDVQNLLPVQAYFNLDGSFNTFIGQGVAFYATANPVQSGLTITNSTLNSSPIGNTSPSTGVFTNIATTTGTISTQPTAATDIVNLLALQSYAAGISWKQPCAVATLTNITLSGLQTIDTYTTLAGDRVLVKNQSTQADNGIYIAATGAWSRAEDANTWNELIAAISFIEYGSQKGGAWFCTAQPGGTLGVTPVIFSQFTTSATYSAGTGLTLTGTVFSITPVGSASTYGSATQTPVFTTNASGQVSSVTNTTITPAVGSITGFGTGVATALAVNTGSAGSVVVNGGALGTPSSGTLTNCTFPTLNQNTTGYAAGLAGGVAGSLPYQSAVNTTTFLAAGSNGQVLTLAAGVPSWATPTTGTVTSVGGTGTVNGITLTGTVTSTGNLTLGGTLGNIANSQLTNSSITFGATAAALGTTVSGFNAVTIGATTASTGAFTVLSTSSTTNTTPVLGFNASNCNFALGATVANSYLQSVMQNKSATAGASTNWAVSNDLGTDSTYYGEFGMNSSVFSASTPADYFSINNGIYFTGHDGDLSYGSGNGYKTYFAWGTTGQSAHVINATGAIGLSTNLGTTPAGSGTSGYGTAGYLMQTQGSVAAPTWVAQSTIAAGSASTATTATNATNTAITDDTTTNTTMYPTWVTTTSGNQAQKTSSTKLSFNPSTGNLTSTVLTSTNDASISGLTVGKGASSVAGNTVVGFSALASNTTGDNSVAIGFLSLNSNTTGTSNSALGLYSLRLNTTGSNNSAFGQQALYSNTTASNNTAVGYQAGYSNVTGANNAFFGRVAGYANTADNGTAIGSLSMQSNTSGASNTAVGCISLNSNTTGSTNVAVGQQALQANTTGSQNTVVGYQAGYTNTTSSGNNFFGQYAGYYATGANNTAIGNSAYAQSSTASGANNVAVGNSALSSNTSGSTNTAVGYNAGSAITTGTKNSILGAYNGNQGSLDIRTASNYIVLSDGDGNPRGIFDGSGNFLVGTATTTLNPTGGFNLWYNSGSTVFGMGHASGTPSGNSYQIFSYNGSTIGTINQAGTSAVLYNTTSDYRLKNNVTPIQNALSTISSLKPISFTWEDGRQDDGFLAHELQEIIPNCVTGEKDAIDENGKPKYQQMDSSGVIPFLVKAIQELKAEFDAYKATHP